MQTTWLTHTKFIPPQLRDDFIPRGRLLDTLQTAIASPPCVFSLCWLRRPDLLFA